MNICWEKKKTFTFYVLSLCSLSNQKQFPLSSERETCLRGRNFIQICVYFSFRFTLYLRTAHTLWSGVEIIVQHIFYRKKGFSFLFHSSPSNLFVSHSIFSILLTTTIELAFLKSTLIVFILMHSRLAVTEGSFLVELILYQDLHIP